MDEKEILSGLTDAVVNGKKDQATELSEKALEAGIDPYKAIVNGLANGMEIMSQKYEDGEVFMPHLLMSSNAMYAGMDVLTPHLKMEGAEKAAVLVIGTAEGDVHDIGKNLVKTMMSAVGFDVIDLGKDVPVPEFADAVEKNKADVVSISTLMTSTMDNMENTVKDIASKGLRDKVKIVVGGAPVTEAFAKDIGADEYKADAMGAAKWAKEAVKELDASRWG